MKNWKSLLITVFSFFAIGSMVLLNSCVKDPCSDLQCKNGGSCSDGFCQCPTGYEGAECEIPAATRFTGTWAGTSHVDNFPVNADTVRIIVTGQPNYITMYMGTGNTSLLGYSGTATTPECNFVTYVKDGVEVHVYITVDGGLMRLYLQTIDHNTNRRQDSYFTGVRIAN